MASAWGLSTIGGLKPILNLSAYRFVELHDAAELRERLHSLAAALALKGTVILAAEGINIALAGGHSALRSWVETLRRDARFAGIDVKFSESASLPFRRLVIRVKREIIRMNQSVVRPQHGRAPQVDAQTLARWLDAGCDDAGREVLLLDTRNAFEVDHGRFRNALDWRLRKFSDFPAALREHRRALEGKTVVTYCTGGIRCEKAALWVQLEGVTGVHQLDGGILNYFAHNGAAHFEGRCFVFDERIGVNGTLAAASEA